MVVFVLGVAAVLFALELEVPKLVRSEVEFAL